MHTTNLSGGIRGAGVSFWFEWHVCTEMRFSRKHFFFGKRYSRGWWFLQIRSGWFPAVKVGSWGFSCWMILKTERCLTEKPKWSRWMIISYYFWASTPYFFITTSIIIVIYSLFCHVQTKQSPWTNELKCTKPACRFSFQSFQLATGNQLTSENVFSATRMVPDIVTYNSLLSTMPCVLAATWHWFSDILDDLDVSIKDYMEPNPNGHLNKLLELLDTQV